MKIFVPMLTPKFTLEESLTYDDMTNEKFSELMAAERREEILDQAQGNVNFHERDVNHNPNTHVKIRLMHNQPVSRANEQHFDSAIIHFHGGGFVCQDSSAHQNYTRKWAI